MKKTANKKVAQKYEFNEKNPLYNVLNQVIDPEIGVGIADMGLIYQAETKKNVAHIVMTLTSMGCPLGPEIAADVDDILRQQKNIKDVEIEVVWDPPWSPDRMKKELKDMLFGVG